MKSAIITDAEATKLLTKHTCLACHKVGERAAGLSYKDVVKRNVTNEQIEALIYEPKPENWPELTPMVLMTNVPKADVKKIAAWINSLGEVRQLKLDQGFCGYNGFTRIKFKKSV